MGNLEYLIGEQTYQVADNVKSNRFNFYGLVPITEELFEDKTVMAEYSLNDNLPEDVKTAVNTMIDNDVVIEDFTGITVLCYEEEDTYYYLLTW